MQQNLHRWRFLAVGAGLLLGAASKPPASLPVQINDAGPLAAAPAAPAPKPKPATGAVVVTNANFEAAPVPDESVDAPGQAHEAAGTQLSPALLSEKAAFAGNGFGAGSSQEQATNDRQSPAAGLSLSVPVK